MSRRRPTTAMLEQSRYAGAIGGRRTVEVHGREHMKRIGLIGAFRRLQRAGKTEAASRTLARLASFDAGPSR